MNNTEHLLTCLAEECGEVAKECHKSLRFGLTDKVTRDPKGPRGILGPTNAQKIVMELNDLMGVITMLEAEGIIPRDWQQQPLMAAKVDKVKAYMEYAVKVGALQETKANFAVQVVASQWGLSGFFLKGPFPPKYVKQHGYAIQPSTDGVWPFANQKQAEAKARILERHMSWPAGTVQAVPYPSNAGGAQ